MTSFLFCYGLASFIIGPIIDRIGPRKVLGYNFYTSGAVIMTIMGAVFFLYILFAELFSV